MTDSKTSCPTRFVENLRGYGYMKSSQPDVGLQRYQITEQVTGNTVGGGYKNVVYTETTKLFDNRNDVIQTVCVNTEETLDQTTTDSAVIPN